MMPDNISQHVHEYAAGKEFTWPFRGGKQDQWSRDHAIFEQYRTGTKVTEIAAKRGCGKERIYKIINRHKERMAEDHRSIEERHVAYMVMPDVAIEKLAKMLENPVTRRKFVASNWTITSSETPSNKPIKEIET